MHSRGRACRHNVAATQQGRAGRATSDMNLTSLRCKQLASVGTGRPELSCAKNGVAPGVPVESGKMFPADAVEVGARPRFRILVGSAEFHSGSPIRNLHFQLGQQGFEESVVVVRAGLFVADR